MADAESMFLQAMEIRKALMTCGVNTEFMRPFICTLEELDEFRDIAAIAGPPPREGELVKIAGIEFYVVPKEAIRVPFFGIWHEAWQACCRLHFIDNTEREQDRCNRQAKYSFYNPDRIDVEEIPDG